MKLEFDRRNFLFLNHGLRGQEVMDIIFSIPIGVNLSIRLFCRRGFRSPILQDPVHPLVGSVSNRAEVPALKEILQTITFLLRVICVICGSDNSKQT